MLPVEDSDGPCPTLASYVLHNSLAYGADWSQVSLDSPPPASPQESQQPAQPQLTHVGGGHLRIQYESPTASFDTSLEDEMGRYIPEPPSPPPQPDPRSVAVPPTPALDSPSVSCLLASCSFYDHMMHVWRWDWCPKEEEAVVTEEVTSAAAVTATGDLATGDTAAAAAGP